VKVSVEVPDGKHCYVWQGVQCPLLSENLGNVCKLYKSKLLVTTDSGSIAIEKCEECRKGENE